MVRVTRHMGVKSTLDDLTKLEAVYVQPRMAGRNTKGWVTGTFKSGRRPSLSDGPSARPSNSNWFMNAANDASGASDTGPHNDGNNIVYELWRGEPFHTHRLPTHPARSILRPCCAIPFGVLGTQKFPNFVTTFHLSWRRRSPFHFPPTI